MASRTDITLRIIFGLAVLTGITYHQYSKYSDEQDKENRERAAIEQSIQKIDALAKKYNANNDWLTKLKERSLESRDRVFTTDIEAEWIKKSPIVFIGEIHDVVSISQTEYEIKMAPGLFSGVIFLAPFEINLSLKASKSLIDSFLAAHKSTRDSDFGNNVAVIANITHITSAQMDSGDGYTIDTRSGNGTVVDMLFVGEYPYCSLSSDCI